MPLAMRLALEVAAVLGGDQAREDPHAAGLDDEVVDSRRGSAWPRYLTTRSRRRSAP